MVLYSYVVLYKNYHDNVQSNACKLQNLWFFFYKFSLPLQRWYWEETKISEEKEVVMRFHYYGNEYGNSCILRMISSSLPAFSAANQKER